MQFYAGPQAADSEFYILDIEEDNIALEDDEVFTLMLSSPSDIRVRIGGTAGGVAYHATTRVTIQDNDCEHMCILDYSPFKCHTCIMHIFYHPFCTYSYLIS